MMTLAEMVTIDRIIQSKMKEKSHDFVRQLSCKMTVLDLIEIGILPDDDEFYDEAVHRIETYFSKRGLFQSNT
jgi:hypothetical protein